MLQAPTNPQIVHAMRVWAMVLVVLLTFAEDASAQSQESWLVLPVAADDSAAWMEPTAAEIRRELRERGLEVWSLEAATREFEARESAPAAQVSSSEIQEWIQRSRDALTYLAGGDYGKARRELTELQKLSKRVAEELNRERERAQEVLDSCLDMVRLMLETRTRGEAKEQARACRQLVPRVEPGGSRHPPAVIEVLSEVDSETSERGALTIESEPAGCAFRINGLSFGTTPDSMRLFFGDYRVQAECNGDGRGRVHPVKIDSSEARVFIDARFDSVVQTQPFLQLRYPDTKAKSKWMASDANKVRTTVRATHVLVATSPQAGMLRLERLSTSPDDPRGVALLNTTAAGPSREDVDLAVKTILKNECKDFTGARPTDLSGCGGAKTWPTDRTPKAHFWAGVAVASLGSVSLIAGYGLHGGRKKVGDSWSSDVANTELQAKWLNLGNGVIITGAVGGAGLVAAMPLVLPYRSKTPWWAWLSGGLGVVALAGSIASAVSIPSTVPDCTRAMDAMAPTAAQCVDHGQKRDRAILLGITAAPLLTMPLVYLFRPKEAKVTPNIEIGARGGRVLFSGEF